MARAKFLLQGGLPSKNLTTITNDGDLIPVCTNFILTMRQDHIYDQIEKDNLTIEVRKIENRFKSFV